MKNSPAINTINPELVWQELLNKKIRDLLKESDNIRI